MHLLSLGVVLLGQQRPQLWEQQQELGRAPVVQPPPNRCLGLLPPAPAPPAAPLQWQLRPQPPAAATGCVRHQGWAAAARRPRTLVQQGR